MVLGSAGGFRCSDGLLRLRLATDANASPVRAYPFTGV